MNEGENRKSDANTSNTYEIDSIWLKKTFRIVKRTKLVISQVAASNNNWSTGFILK